MLFVIKHFNDNLFSSYLFIKKLYYILNKKCKLTVILCFIEKKGKKDETKDDEEEVAAGVQPSRALNAYMFFSNEMIPKIKVDEGLSHKDAMSRSGQMWQQMSDDDKKPYNEKHEKDVKR